MNFQSFNIFWNLFNHFPLLRQHSVMLASGGGLTSQLTCGGPQVSDWASPVSTADQSAGQHSCWAPQVSGTEVPPWAAT